MKWNEHVSRARALDQNTGRTGGAALAANGARGTVTRYAMALAAGCAALLAGCAGRPQTNTGDMYAPKNASQQVDQRYQSFRIVAAYDAAQLSGS